MQLLHEHNFDYSQLKLNNLPDEVYLILLHLKMKYEASII